MKAYMINFDTNELEAMELAKDATHIEKYILEEASKRKAWEDYMPRVITGDAMSIYRFEDEDAEMTSIMEKKLNRWKSLVYNLNHTNLHNKEKFLKTNHIGELKFKAYYDSEINDVVLSSFSKIDDDITRIDYRVKNKDVYLYNSKKDDNISKIHSDNQLFYQTVAMSHMAKEILDLDLIIKFNNDESEKYFAAGVSI